MFRPASRALLRAPAVAARGPTTTRLISTSSSEAPKSRSWKNTVFRLGLAAGAIYYYNTASVFAKEPTFSFHSQPQADPEPSNAPTLDSIKPRIREEREKQQQRNPTAQPTTDADGTLKTPQELEEEASQEAAFNPETGEINWDCPCLGGMAHGPCGEDFKAAFSCFVYSQEEPKGIDCIEKFKGMQDCFRKYPEVYGAELEDDEEAAAATEAATEAAKGGPAASEVDASSNPDEKRAHAREVNAQVKAEAEKQPELAESEALMPKAWHDTEDKNEAVKTAK